MNNVVKVIRKTPVKVQGSIVLVNRRHMVNEMKVIKKPFVETNGL